MASISIITATLNAEVAIQSLLKDINEQTDKDFTWIIVDGMSTDNTVAVLERAVGANQRIIVERDFGIYDALNKGVKACLSDYYIVVGADDRIDSDFIRTYRSIAASSNADIVSASVREAGKLVTPGKGSAWLRGHRAYISQHSVGALIRRTLHDRFGYYSNKFPIAADQLFIKKAILGGASLHCAPNYVAGEFAQDGLSSRMYLDCLFEFTLVQLRTERWKPLQLALLLIRIVRHWSKALSSV